MDDSKSDDGEDGQFAVSTDLVQLPNVKEAGYSTIDFDGILSKPLELREDLAKGCGGALWPAGLVLGKFILRRHLEALQDKVMSGLPQLLARRTDKFQLRNRGWWRAGRVRLLTVFENTLISFSLGLAQHCDGFARPIYVTDQENMLDLMRHNIEHNGLSEKVEAHVYDWGEPRPDAIPAKIDIILAADCVYFEPAFPLLLKTLRDVVGPDSICYFCFKKRRRADMHFVKSIKKAFVVTEVEDDPDKDVYKRESIHLSEANQRNGSLLTRPRLKIQART